jgi:co-chaperonin GroES (HSP10)
MLFLVLMVLLVASCEGWLMQTARGMSGGKVLGNRRQNRIVSRNSDTIVLSALGKRSQSHHVADFQEVEELTSVPGQELPPEIAAMSAIYDMVLVERFTAPPKTTGGLFIPAVEGKDSKQLAVVISVPNAYGLESEGGRLQSIEEIAPVKKGDLVYVRDVWGIGPKNLEVGKRSFSFHKAAHISAVVSSSPSSS